MLQLQEYGIQILRQMFYFALYSLIVDGKKVLRNQSVLHFNILRRPCGKVVM